MLHVLAATVVGFLLAGAYAVASAAPASAHDDVTLELVQATPAVVGPGDVQELTVRVTNTSEDPVTDVQIALQAGWRPLTSRTEVAVWVNPGGTTTAGTTQVVEPVDDLAPGQSVDVPLELQVSSLQFGTDAEWGPRRLSLSASVDGDVVDILRTFLIYDPGAETAPGPGTSAGPSGTVRLAATASATGPVLDPAEPEAYTDAVISAIQPGGELDRLLAAATTNTPRLSLAVDPAVVVASATGPGASWAQTLRDLQADVVLLPPYDTDLGALAHAGLRPTDVAAVTTPDALLGDAWTSGDWSTTVAWPVGAPDLDSLATAKHAAADVVIVADTPDPTGEGTGSVLDLVTTSAGDVPMAVADPMLTQLLATVGDGTTAASTIQLLAETAVLADTGDVDLLGALPRGWAPEDVASFSQLLADLDAVDWVEVVGLSDLLDAVPSVGAHTAIPQSSSGTGELRPAAVRGIAERLDAVAAFVTVAEDPGVLTSTADRDLVAPLSVAFREYPEARRAALDLALDRADRLTSGVQVVERADVTFVGDAGSIPVRVRNDLPVDATVTVVLQPEDSRLVVESQPTVTVPAAASRDVQVRVRAIGSGDVSIDVELRAPGGATVSDDAAFALRVRAGWETVGTAVLAAGVALLFVVGIWRTVRRGRSDRRTTGEELAATGSPTPTTPEDGKE